MRRLLLLLAAATALGATSARAQVTVYFRPLGDTASGAVPGVETQIEVWAQNPNWYPIQSANLTFYFDTGKVHVLGVRAIQYADSIVSTSAGAGYLTVSSVGYVYAYGTDVPLYRLRVKLGSGVTDGTYLWVKGDSVPVQYYGMQPVFGSIAQVCHASKIWGDVDASDQVDSRDALITLSAAVGLTVTGFDLAVGDVDGDGLTNSRDALIMLSYAIALPTSGTRVGAGEPDACPGLTAPGDTVVFVRNDAPSGLWTLGASSTAPVAVPGGTNVQIFDGQRLAADGRTIAYACPGSPYLQVCRINTDGTGFAQLTSDTSGVDNKSADWSPSGSRIVWVKGGVVWTMNADGSGQAQVGLSPITANWVRWGRDSTKLGYNNGALHVVNSDGTGDVTIPTGPTTLAAFLWSPAGDSIAFVQGDLRLRVVPIGGGTPQLVFGFAGTLTGADWGAQGIIFSLDPGTGSPPSIWVMRGVTGPIFRVTRPTTYDLGPSWRRNP